MYFSRNNGAGKKVEYEDMENRAAREPGQRQKDTAANFAGRRKSKVVLVDGTLREGEQSAGVFFTFREKLELLRLMDKAGVRIADCGMPAVSDEEFLTLKKLVSAGFRTIRIGASIRCRIEEAELFKKTGATDCFIIVPVSDIHIKVKFGMEKAAYAGYAERVVAHCVKLGIEHVHVVLEDATRADPEFILFLLGKLRGRPVEAFYICDTLGVALPGNISRLVGAVKNALSPGSAAAVGVHCHNDFGLALANTLAAFDSGAAFLTFTQNGIGERAGNVKFHELALALARLKKVPLKVDLGMIAELSEAAEKMSGIFMSPVEPVIGFNAYRHESGIHVSGLLRNRKVYEEFRPEAIGRRNEFVLGKHSGVCLIDKLLGEFFSGLKFSPAERSSILKTVKETRVKAGKAGNAKMRKTLSGFYSSALGGLSNRDFVEIVRSLVRERV